jgi:hypothetical protein
MMDGILTIIDKLVVILPIEIIRMFFPFKGLLNYMSGIKWCRRKNFGLFKENKVFRVVGVLINN